jgi:hypothetical protein
MFPFYFATLETNATGEEVECFEGAQEEEEEHFDVFFKNNPRDKMN